MASVPSKAAMLLATSVVALLIVYYHAASIALYQTQPDLIDEARRYKRPGPDRSKLHHKPQALFPAIHWDHYVHHLDHIIPNKKVKVFWSHPDASPTTRHQIAHADLTFKHRTVYLGHSARIKSVDCGNFEDGPGKMRIAFMDFAAFSTAKEHWPVALDEFESDDGLLFGSYFEGCGDNFHEGHRSWTMVNHIEFHDDEMAIVARIEHMDLREVLQSADLTFGHYEPYEPAASVQVVPEGRGETVEEDANTLRKRLPNGDKLKDKLKKGKDKLKKGKDYVKEKVDNTEDKVQDKVDKGKDKMQDEAEKLRNWETVLRTMSVPSVTHDFGFGGGKTLTTFKDNNGKALMGDEIFPELGKLLTSKIWCVDCRLSGKGTISGSLSFTVSDLLHGKGFSGGSITFEGNVDARLAFGIDTDIPFESDSEEAKDSSKATDAKENTASGDSADSENSSGALPVVDKGVHLPAYSSFTYNFIEIPLTSPMPLGEFAVIGAYISLDFTASVSLDLQGQFQAGVMLRLPKATFNIDPADNSKTRADGFDKVQLEPILFGNGTVGVGLKFGIPLSFNIGFDVLPNKLKDKLNFGYYVAERPTLILQAKSKMTPNVDDDGFVESIMVGGVKACPKGTELNMAVSMDTITGLNHKPVVQTLFKLVLYARSWCWGGGLFVNNPAEKDGFQASTYIEDVATPDLPIRRWAEISDRSSAPIVRRNRPASDRKRDILRVKARAANSTLAFA